MHVEPKLFFDHAVAGVFLRGGPQLSDSLKSELRQLGVDLDKKLLPAYPAETFRACIERVGAQLFPELDLDQRHYEMGCIAIAGFQQGTVGGSMFDYLKVIPPERSVQRMQQNLRAAMNFVEVAFRRVAPNAFELEILDVVEMPHFFRALVEKGSAASGRKGTVVTLKELKPPGCVLSFQWPEPPPTAPPE